MPKTTLALRPLDLARDEGRDSAAPPSGGGHPDRRGRSHGAHMSLRPTTTSGGRGWRVRALREGDLLVLPTIPFWALTEHHMDFPGVIAIDIETTLAYLAQTADLGGAARFTHLLIV